MEISERLNCLFSAQVEHQDGSYVIGIPEQELQLGDIDEGDVYRVVVLPTSTTSTEPEENTAKGSDRDRDPQGPPVEKGETRKVEIEDIGEQGDGITRVEQGYVVIVPDTEMGEQVRIEITDVRENVAFADVADRLSYYD